MRIKAQNIAMAMEINEDIALDIVDSIHEAYRVAGMDMPKHLNDAIFDIEAQLADYGVPSH